MNGGAACNYGKTDWGIGKLLNEHDGRRHDATAILHSSTGDSPQMRRLVEARAQLDIARRNAKWKRECKKLQAASHEVQAAALAARDAGIGWVEIGDVLGIERAAPSSGSTAIDLPPTPPAPTPMESARHRVPRIVDKVTALHLSPEVKAIAG